MAAIARCILVLIAGACVPHAAAQDYPHKPVRMIVPLAPGGGADLLARFVSPGLTENLGKPVVVENRAGGGGHIGSDFVAKSAPDGYTLLMAGIPQAIGMSLYKKLPYDMAKDLAPVTQAATFPSIIAVHPSLPVKSIWELLALARSRPGQLNYGANTGSPNHLGIELLSWYGIFAPAGTPRDIIVKLNAGSAAALKNADVAGKLAALGAEVATTTPDEFDRIVRDEIRKWAVVVKASGVTLE